MIPGLVSEHFAHGFTIGGQVGVDHRGFQRVRRRRGEGFAAEGSRLLLGARRMDRLEQVAAEARAAGAPDVHVHALDVASTPSVEAFVA